MPVRPHPPAGGLSTRPSTFDGFLPEGPNDSLVQIERGLNYLVNVGSVGQPRDGDPRAAFGIYDSEGPSLGCSGESNTRADAAQRRILDAGLPGEPGEPPGELADSASRLIATRGSHSVAVGRVLRFRAFFRSSQLRRERVLRGA